VTVDNATPEQLATPVKVTSFGEVWKVTVPVAPVVTVAVKVAVVPYVIVETGDTVNVVILLVRIR
jgi:hypothetical protein